MVRGSKVLKLVIDDWGSFLGMEKGCYVLRDKHGEAYLLAKYLRGEIKEWKPRIPNLT